MNNNMKLTYPAYFKNFRCIGGECSDTCCKGWDIEIDKDTFEDYCKVKDDSTRIIIENNIIKNDECTSSDLDYGVIKLNNDGLCPFLDAGGYCSIYTKLGEEYLSNICTHFPRIINKVDNNYEISLDVACNEAAQLILGEKEGIKFECGEKEFIKYIINDEYNTNSKKFRSSPIRYLKEIRDYSIRIIQNRNYNLSERLYILGDLMEKLVEAEDNDDCSSIPEILENFNMNMSAEAFKRDEMDYIFQIIFFRNIVDTSNISEKAISAAFKEYTEELLHGFGADEIKDFRDNSQKYMDAFEDYESKIMEENSYIFENYMVNLMYNYLFPFSESDDMFEGYMMLVVRYSFIRFYLVGMHISSGVGGDTPQDVIKFISSFGRSIEHDKNYIPKIADYIEKNKYFNIDFARKLL
ncbi:flagellin lysine-N-methylase [uncultured Clostridium sp.]|uniref:flagellin lysine-N-methylase n=1 Tax=uncultured Clostridium sp. TaxID=59620 RepID=UPI0025DADB45|nr:flagellin lysine-N-methylase [uncultured Clostridium sp.]